MKAWLMGAGATTPVAFYLLVPKCPMCWAAYAAVFGATLFSWKGCLAAGCALLAGRRLVAARSGARSPRCSN